MRALGRKKTHVFLGNARPKSNARAHLKQRKKHSGEWCFVFVKAIDLYRGLLGSLLICVTNDNIIYQQNQFTLSSLNLGWGPRVVVSTAAFHARVRGSVRSRRFERNKNVSSPSTCENQYCGEPP